MRNITINPQLYSYAYLATAFDNRVDIFSNYVTLVEYFFAEHSITKSVSFDYLLNEINEYYELNMPRATLKAILARMQHQGKIIHSSKGITPQYNKFDIDLGDLIQGIDNDVYDLFSDIQDFLKQRGYIEDISSIRDLICDFIYINSIEMMNLFVNRTCSFTGERALFNHIIDYIVDAFEYKKDKYKTLLKLNMGAMRVSLLDLKPDKIKDLNEKNVISTVILDTNYLLRLFNLQSEIDCKTAKETYEILAKGETRIIVREETIEELIKSISKYLTNSQINSTTKSLIKQNDWRVSGFFAAENRGVTRSEMFKYTNFDFVLKKLQEFSIEVNSEKIAPIDSSDIESLINEKNRDSYTKENATHDLTLITYCLSLRKGMKKRISDEKIWILTNDVKLAKWHKNRCFNYGFACMTESQLNSYIWMQTGNEQLNYNAALIALTDRQSLGIEDLLSFQSVFMQHYSQADQENLDNLIMVFASGSVCESEVLDIHDNESLNDLVAKKIENVSKEREIALEISDKVNKLKEELSDAQSQLLTEKSGSIRKQVVRDILKEKDENSQKIQNIDDTCQNLKEKQILYKKIMKRIRNTGRILAIGILVVMIAVYFALMNNLSSDITSETWKVVLDYIVPVIISIFLPFLAFTITSIVCGEPMNFKEAFRTLCLRINKKKMFTTLGVVVSIDECQLQIKNITEQLENYAKEKEDLKNEAILIDNKFVQLVTQDD